MLSALLYLVENEKRRSGRTPRMYTVMTIINQGLKFRSLL